jgi:hypothetical protein
MKDEALLVTAAINNSRLCLRLHLDRTVVYRLA